MAWGSPSAAVPPHLSVCVCVLACFSAHSSVGGIEITRGVGAKTAEEGGWGGRAERQGEGESGGGGGVEEREKERRRGV